MAIFLDSSSKILVQGMTGSEGTKHTRRMVAGGSAIVAGVTPGKGGQEVDGIPVFNNVADAVAATGANVSVVFVPPRFTKGAVIEAVDAGLPLVVVITEGVPVHDTAAFFQYAQNAGTTRIIGPNCPGIISPEQSNAGITPSDIARRGRIGLVSKSGTLTYQMMYELRDLGFTTAVGIGGDPIIGTTHIDCLQAFQDDPETDAIVMIGEIGGDAEERAAAYIAEHITKPVVGYVAGFTAPEGKTMGHAGAIVSGSSGTAQAKKEALEAVGVKVGKTPSETARLMREIIAQYVRGWGSRARRRAVRDCADGRWRHGPGGDTATGDGHRSMTPSDGARPFASPHLAATQDPHPHTPRVGRSAPAAPVRGSHPVAGGLGAVGLAVGRRRRTGQFGRPGRDDRSRHRCHPDRSGAPGTDAVARGAPGPGADR